MLKDLLTLAKIRITIPVALTGFTGFLLQKGNADGALLPVLGILLLAMGSAVLNNITEHRFDAKMQRTQNRPLPSKRISLTLAWIYTILLATAGGILLFVFAGITGFILGAITLLWYNLVYTFLKRFTPWAVIPGSLVGALPPAIGWVAAGGSLNDPTIVILATFFFVAQIPHFWILLIKYGDDYLNAGFKSLSTRLNPSQLKRITFSWILATALIALLFTQTGLIISCWGKIIFSLLSLSLIFFMFFGLFIRRQTSLSLLFISFNLYFLLLMICIWTDVLWLSWK